MRRVRAAPFGRPASFAAIDANGDGALDLDEIKRAAAALFDELDVDDKSMLSGSKLRRRLTRKHLTAAGIDNQKALNKDQYLIMVERFFEAVDVDRDGTISRAEFNSAAGLALRRLFY
jgi:Ca2+-binding EF-hand superfamily protein